VSSQDEASAPTIAKAVFDLSRGRQALLSVAQPALGALLAIGHLPAPRVMGLGLVAATAGYLAVFSLNDVLDVKVDEAALDAGKAEAEGYDIDTVFLRHPLARGDLSRSFSIAWVVSLGALGAVLAYLLAPVCLALFAAAVVLEVLYCSLRSVTWLKTVVSGLMVGVGGLAGWAAVAPITLAAMPFFVFLVLWEIGGRNLPNDLADLAADRAVGLTTVATVFGARASATATGFVVAGTLIVLALLGQPLVVTLVSLGLGVWAMGLPATVLARTPTSEQAGLYFNRASLLPALAFAASLVGILAR
jgi:4-hydroxybenzoate polyprenyltransferase